MRVLKEIKQGTFSKSVGKELFIAVIMVVITSPEAIKVVTRGMMASKVLFENIGTGIGMITLIIGLIMGVMRTVTVFEQGELRLSRHWAWLHHPSRA